MLCDKGARIGAQRPARNDAGNKKSGPSLLMGAAITSPDMVAAIRGGLTEERDKRSGV